MGMFDNYNNIDPDYIPNNRFKRIPCKRNHIVSGGTNTLVFEVPPHYNEGLLKVSIIFNQKDRLIVVKNPSSITLGEHGLFIECKIDSTESRLFGNTYLDTLVQLKLEYNNKTLYTDLDKIEVIQTLDDDGESPFVPKVSGFGWTED